MLDFSYYQNYSELIDIDLSRQTNKIISRQINFKGKLEENDGATMFCTAEKQPKTIVNIPLDSLVVEE